MRELRAFGGREMLGCRLWGKAGHSCPQGRMGQGPVGEVVVLAERVWSRHCVPPLRVSLSGSDQAGQDSILVFFPLSLKSHTEIQSHTSWIQLEIF